MAALVPTIHCSGEGAHPPRSDVAVRTLCCCPLPQTHSCSSMLSSRVKMENPVDMRVLAATMQ